LMFHRLRFTERQLRLPSLFLLVIAVTVFMLISAGIAWQLYLQPYDDLPTFYWVIHLAFEQGLPAYKPSIFQELGELLNRKIYPFLYPPPSLLLFSPMLLCVDYEQCKLIYSVLNLLLWWALAWALYCFYVRCIEMGYKSYVIGILILFF